MVVRTFLREWTESMRDRRVLVLLGVLLALSLASTLGSALFQRQAMADRAAAVAADAQIWLGQGAVNPHSAAHFGQYAFRPVAPLASFDPGLTPWMGQAVWIEAHYRNPAEARPAETTSIVQRFGDLSPGWILQALLPLVVVLCGFGMVAGERERGVLRLQLVQGAPVLSLVFGKALALLALAGLAIVVLLSPALLSGAGGTDRADLALRAGGIAVAYAAYLAVWVGITLFVSALAGTARQALVVLLCAWAFSVVLLPRFAADVASASHPVADAGAFWEAVEEAKAKGLDGHDPSDARAKALLEDTLRRYGVATPDQLPVDFSGIALQAGEESGNVVFDHFYGQVDATEDAQLRVQRWFVVGSPLLALRSLSVGLAGTDLVHQRDFTDAAEQHRQHVQRLLNEEQMRTGKGMNFTNTADPGFWRSVPTFGYQVPAFARVAHAYAADAAGLLAWLALVSVLLAVAGRRLETRA